MEGRNRIVINNTKPMLHMLKRQQARLIFDDEEQIRSKMYKIIEDLY